MEIEDYRRRIDALDAEITRLINERATCARAIGEAKQRTETSAYAPARERQVLDRVIARNEGPLPDAALQAIYREIISACRALEKPLTIAYWGPPASNTHVAATRRFGSQASFLETGSIAEVFAQVERGSADFGVIPVENSTEGVVAQSLDMFLNSDVRVCAEIYVPIQHNLLSKAASLRDVRRVYTMFQATAQCRNWLSRNLPGVELVETTTTARAAGLAAQEPDAGAIANLAAAEQYGVPVLAEQIEDNPRNRTRFWVIGRLEPAPSGRDKTSILFSVSHRPGALVDALSTFSEHGVSLTFIESRPTKQTPWEYVFFIDVQGHVEEGPESPLVRALPHFREHCLFTRVLGSYPEAENA
ncbi:MAG TPA: prephenate dehydratase [Armatimonadota bacterium]|nr:prephenate dehydratase [Armatimonadota bacterium]